MDLFDNSSRRSSNYEEIDPPVPRRNRRDCLYHILIGFGGVCIGALVVLVLISTFTDSSSNSNSANNTDTDEPLHVNNSNSSSSGESEIAFRNESRAQQATGLKLGLGAPAKETETGNTTENQPTIQEVFVELDENRSIRGKRMKSRAGREYFSFLGIPYAKPPVGNLRFLPPIAIDPWTGTLNATEFKPDCIQKDKYNTIFTTKGSEDCLYINVFTPQNLETSNKRFDQRQLPVLVYIHGGRQYGSATRYGAEYFMDEDVILVSFHYRLGVLGNLNTNDHNARGNQGSKDQVMALQWVQDNINEFGGNKNKVTLFGNSWGAIHVTTHMLSPMSTGLFHQAICQSGTVLMPLEFTQNPMKSAEELAEKLNFTGNSNAELVDFFRNMDVDKLVLESYLLDFQISVESPADTNDVFMPDQPINILQSGQINQVTAIFGVMSGEGLMNSLGILLESEKIEPFNKDWGPNASSALKLNNSARLKDPERIANSAREFYLENKKLSRDVEANFTAMFGDREFFHPAHTFATFQLEKNKTSDDKVYLYYFNLETDKSYGDFLIEPYAADHFLGAGHADELQFLFPYDPFPTVPLGSKFATFSQMMVRFWATFADTGKPTGAEWLPIGDKPYGWFELNAQPKMIDFLGDRMKFWDSFNLTDLYF